MTAFIKIELEDNYLTLPHLTRAQLAPLSSLQHEPMSPTIAPGSPLMTMASPERTLSFGATSVASTLPSSTASVRSSLELERPAASSNLERPAASSNLAQPSVGCTLLKGRVVITLSKPIKVASLSVALNGSTHIAFLGTGKRAHYSRHHIRSQQYLIEPPSSSDPQRQYTLVNDDSVTYPFEIEVPNHLPASVATPQGGTIYRLTAVLTLSKSSGLMSFLSSGSTISSSATVQIYRAPRARCLVLEQPGEFVEDDDEEDELLNADQTPGETEREQRDPADENDVVPAVVSHIWPGHLEASVSIPYTQLPPQSKPDLHLRVRVLREKVAIKCFQSALHERAIFRVQKAGSSITSKKHIVGVRERVVSAQRCDAGWQNDVITSIVPHTFEKVVLFSIPNALRSHNDVQMSRGLNVSTYTSISKLKRHQLKEDLEIKDSEFGEVHIEIQHFLRYSLFVHNSVDSKGKTLSGPVERVLGDVPVVVRGLPSGPECDLSGLPTYLYSFSTSRVSYEDARDYEFEATGVALVEEAAEDGSNTTGPIYGDYERDDALMAIMGYRTPPSYEDSVGRPSMDQLSLSDMRPLEATSTNGSSTNATTTPFSCSNSTLLMTR
ncbi:hypothetical protein EMPS_01645 [Entomortierella parvispora]|uniref:Arrestin-like N-terminal domain-containing protein n=1 Tax=Entomortierella parvispora TaxID=205924 RepID=A0A9P3H398_9FUNG|nr:hypothetical protein EMPS_01645 [Entomortierella parvispora]